MKSENILHWFHLACALALPFAVLLLVSCKQAHEQRADLGPLADPSAIDATFSKAIQGVSVAGLQVNQMLHYEESLRIADQDPNLLISEHGIKVIDRTVDSDTQEIRITVHHSQKIREMDKNRFISLESEDTFAIPDPSSQSSFGMLMAAGLGGIGAMFSAENSSSGPQPIRITYHNYSTSEDNIDPPPAFVGRSNCGGLSPCKLHVTYLSYDEVKWYSDTDYDTYKYDFAFTNQLPYMEGLLGVLVTGCVGFYQTTDGRRLFFRDCQYLTDFQK